MGSRALARLIHTAIGGLFAVLMLQGCGLKGDLYLEDGADPSATIREQENEEFLEESLDEQTEAVEAGEAPSFDEETENILDSSTEEPLVEEETESTERMEGR